MAKDEPAVTLGCRVALRFRVLLEDGTVAESNLDDTEPLRLALGDGTLPPGLELVLIGMRAGEHDRRRLSPEQAWGWPDPDNRHALALADFPAGLVPRAGLVIAFDLPDGDDLLGTVLEVGEHTALVDFNHPLAGRAVDFEVEVVEVLAPPGGVDDGATRDART